MPQRDAILSAFANATLPELLADIGVGTWRWNPSTQAVEWDNATEALFGLDPGTFGGTFEDFIAAIHPDDREDALAIIGKVAAEGGDYSVQHRAQHPDGTIRWLEGQGRIMIDENGLPAAGFGIVYDITERESVELERSELMAKELAARDELTFLIEAGERLTGSLNTERVAERLTGLLVPKLARTCIVDVALDQPFGWLLSAIKSESDSAPRIVSGSSLKLSAAVERLHTSFGSRPIDDARHVLDVDASIDIDYDPAADVVVAVPLVTHSVRIGTVIVVCDREQYARSARLLRAVAERAAVALAHAELYADRSRFLSMFHTSDADLLEQIPGLDVALHYRPATDLVRLGGDLFDVFRSGESEWTLAVGDVCGKGVVAAGHAELVRSALRAAVLGGRDPVTAVEILNSVLLAEPTRPMTTLAIANISAAGPVMKASVVSAGHPAPIVLQDGGWSELAASGTMLGVTDLPRFEKATMDLTPGTSIALFTDGVTEARFGRSFFGTERLGRALANGAAGPARGMVADVGSAVDTWTNGDPADDVLVMVAKAGD